MVFSSLSFLYFFLPLTALLYFAVPAGWRNGVLLAASLVFYAWGEPKLVLMMLFATAVAYFGGLGIDYCNEDRKLNIANKFDINKKQIFVATVVLLLANLFVFKYFNFALSNFAKLFGANPKLSQIALPIGISFYTFQILSYVIDLYRGEIAVQKNFAWLLLYVCLFPQLIAGPIVRYKTVEQELSSRSVSIDDAFYGVVRFVAGLGKKVLLANNLAIIAETIYGGDTALFGKAAYWVAALAYTLQIYFDFSGYSDMAIGIGRIFGFHFEENFNRPYLATSVTNFWRRWHISLSGWFRDYVYIPLGGNRVSPARRILNILIVWALTGLWHGAEWNFVLWGLYYGVLLIIEKTLSSWWKNGVESRVAKALTKGARNREEAFRRLDIANVIWDILMWFVTMYIVVVGWVLFNRSGSGEIAQALGMMFSGNTTYWLDAIRANTELLYGIIWLPAAVLTVALEKGGAGKLWNLCKSLLKIAMFKKTDGQPKENKETVNAILCDVFTILWSLGVLVLCLMQLFNSSYNPFIYFRF